MLRKIILILVCCAFWTSCEKDLTKRASSTSPILFQMDYVNYAWGYVHNGWFIDEKGHLYSYDDSSLDSWAEIENGHIHKDSLHMNFSQSTKIGAQNLNTVLQYYKKALEMKGDSLSAPETIMADAGTQMFYAYEYEYSCNCYNAITIKRYGDITQTNTHANAEQIYNWMKNLVIIF